MKGVSVVPCPRQGLVVVLGEGEAGARRGVGGVPPSKSEEGLFGDARLVVLRVWNYLCPKFVEVDRGRVDNGKFRPIDRTAGDVEGVFACFGERPESSLPMAHSVAGG